MKTLDSLCLKVFKGLFYKTGEHSKENKQGPTSLEEQRLRYEREAEFAPHYCTSSIHVARTSTLMHFIQALHPPENISTQ